MKSQKLRAVFALLLTFNPQPSTFAQGTAFTYQGRLDDSGQPANGLYDLRFSIFNANTNGNLIAGPATNSAISVSNGLFTVTLDFGPGVFTGTARWLEIAVRTNGASSFVTVSPRQTLTAVPYAILASDVSNANIARLNGTNAFTGTNYFTGPNSFAGSFTGDGSGLTNLSGFTVNATNMDNAGDFTRMCSLNLGAAHINRFCWTNAHAKIQQQRGLRLMMTGVGWVFDGALGDIFYDLTNVCPYAGSYGFNGFINNWTPLDGWGIGTITGGYVVNADGTGFNTNWYQTFIALTNNGASLFVSQAPTSTLPAQDNFELDYLAAPDGGTFKVQTNVNGGAWTDLAGFTAVSANNNVVVGRTITWAMPTPATVGVLVVNTSLGTNRIVSMGSYNSTITNGLILQSYALQSSGLYQAGLVPTNNTVPVFASWKPDLVLVKIDDSNGPGGNLAFADWPAFQTNIDVVMRAAAPAADMVVCGAWPYDLTTETVYQQGLARTNMMRVCLAARRGYFNVHDIWPSFTESTARGYWEPPGAPNYGHLTNQAYSMYAALLWQWLGLTSQY